MTRRVMTHVTAFYAGIALVVLIALACGVRL